MTPLLVALGALVGAPLRFALAGWLDSDSFPLGIWLANVLGSVIVGFVGGLGVGAHPTALVATGFCGAFTTYSAFATECVDRGTWRGGIYTAATVVVALAGCFAGFWVGDRLAQA